MKSRYELFSIAMIVIAAIATFAVLPSLPARVTTHWNAYGQADGNGPRWVLWLLGPGIMCMMFVLARLLPWLSPRRYEVQASGPTYPYLIAVLVGMFGYFYAVVLLAALGVAVAVERAVPAGVFVLLILLGNPLGKVQPNFFIGIRTPWTLASPRVWHATHRLAARVMVGTGLLGLAAVLFGAPFWLVTPLMIGWVFVPLVYSLLCYKRLEKTGKLEQA